MPDLRQFLRQLVWGEEMEIVNIVYNDIKCSGALDMAIWTDSSAE